MPQNSMMSFMKDPKVPISKTFELLKVWFRTVHDLFLSFFLLLFFLGGGGGG